ncbi:MAG: hypothetical protein KF889_23215 [Alphaproteobacteria bacterium]|nr:hypothetical protein [Alphaproteobacteria bacterium]MCW5744470.1 hypothetical protein [Alphaproteobacteria bacterium]
MSRIRPLSPDFWTWEAVIDCTPMSRLLFLGLQNFADPFGVLPLKSGTIRMQVFPGDEIDDAAVRAMLEELAAHGLVRFYTVEGLAYLRIVDWRLLHRVARRARRRYPADPAEPEPPPPPPPQPQPVPADATEQAPPDPATAPVEPAEAVPSERPPPAPIAKPERWRRIIKNLLRQYWARHPLIELMDDDIADRWTAKWIAQGCDFQRDIVPVVRDFCVMKPFCGPPVGFQELDEHVGRNRARREAGGDNQSPIVPEEARETSWAQDVLTLPSPR